MTSASPVVLPSIHDMFPDLLFQQLEPSPSSSRGSTPLKERAKPRAQPKKHYCKLCLRGFNRPSNLAIHMNIHTGATPFVCPFPACGRAFNVKANMQRHYRNHEGCEGELDIRRSSSPPRRRSRSSERSCSECVRSSPGRPFHPEVYAPSHSALRRDSQSP